MDQLREWKFFYENLTARLIARLIHIKGAHPICQDEHLHFNPNTFTVVVGESVEKPAPQGGRKGGWRKKWARPQGPELEPGT